jgi:hypothetical protein
MVFKVIVRRVGVLPHFNYVEDARNHKPKKIIYLFLTACFRPELE